MTAFSRGKTAEILGAFKPMPEPEVSEASRITVHAAVSRFSFVYEKIRNAVDYRDDHLLCKAAIGRILKRQLLLESDPAAVALGVIRELIAARYLPNGVLPESLATEGGVVVKKYQVLSRLPGASEHHREWLIGILSAELEELFRKQSRDKFLVNFLYESLGDRITLRGATLDENERRLQTYIACHRVYARADDEIMGYKLARIFVPSWTHPEEWLAAPQDTAKAMREAEYRVRTELRHPLALKFSAAVKPWAVALGMLREALLERPGREAEILENEKALGEAIALVARRRDSESRTKLRRGTVRAIIYIFLTKILIALAIEVPFETILYKQIQYLSLAINITFPPILMFLIGSLIKVPGKENIERIQKAVDELLSVEGPKGREIKVAKPRGFIGRQVFRLLYALTFLLVFDLIYRFLLLLHFTWVSSAIFIFFLCIVSFFAYRLRLASREYVVVEGPSNVVFDFFSLPILRAGSWLSRSVSRINIFVFFFDFIIEAPYKILLNALEEWFAFMKEKKEELQ